MISLHGHVAIIGMACIFPGASDLKSFWQNIVHKIDSVSDPPAGLGFEEIYDPHSTANDRIYCKRGGFIGELARFSPLDFGILPRSANGGDADHFLALRIAKEALADAGYSDGSVDHTRVEVAIGKAAYVTRASTIVLQHSFVVDQTLDILKKIHPEYSKDRLQEIRKALKASLPPFDTDTLLAIIPNLLSGRIANRLDFMGPNYVVDAACASSLIALEHAMQDLLAGKCDMAIAGGVHAYLPSHVVLIFCQLGALSRKSQIRPFDKDADGTLLGEGVGMVVLKRLEDAERDGDRIYAVIRGVGTSSDGKAMGLLAPRVEGQELALRRAYDIAGISPNSVGLIEAHGTGTPVGDAVEIQALSRIFGRRDGIPSVAIGTVKSMISHGIPSAGIAGLIKTALALHHKIIPPTLHCEEPNPKLELEKTPLYINTETRPWIHGGKEPRRAGVSAFGFGGINAHVVLEEYTGPDGNASSNYHHRWDTEVFILQGDTRQELIQKSNRLLLSLSRNAAVNLKDLAYTLNCPLAETSRYCLSIVASTPEDLEQKLGFGLKRLADPGCKSIQDRSGIFFFEDPLYREGTLAFLFPGEGSQYLNMLSDLCLHFPEVRLCFDRADRVFLEEDILPLPSQIVFPPPLAQSSASSSSEEAMWGITMAVSATSNANLAMHTLLRSLAITPQAVLGHSSGDFCALVASAAVPIDDEGQLIYYLRNLNRIYKVIEEKVPEARLLTVGGVDRAVVSAVIEQENGALSLAIDNCPNQVVLCGSEEAAQRAYGALQKRGAICSFLPFNRAYHTASYKPVWERFTQFFQEVKIVPPRTVVYSCATAQPYPHDPDTIRALAADQWVQPVRFREAIQSMFDDGVRIFVEVGPRNNLTGFVNDILGKRRYLAVPSNVPIRSGVTQLNYLVGLLAAHGVPMQLDTLYKRRAPHRISFERSSESAERDRKAEKSFKLDYTFPRMRLERSLFPEAASAATTPQEPSQVEKVAALDQKTSVPAGEDDRLAMDETHPQGMREAVLQPADSRAGAMREYLLTMEQFLGMHQEIMAAFLDRSTLAWCRGQASKQGGMPGCPGGSQHVVRESPGGTLSTSWPSPIAHFPRSSKFHCSRLSENGHEIWSRINVDDMLHHRERQTWHELAGPEGRRRDWLLGRLAAKEAVRLFLVDCCRSELAPADIEIVADAYGRPSVAEDLMEKLGCRISVSIAHAGGVAVAVAGECGDHKGVGIDVEPVGRSHEGLERAALTAEEQALLATLPVAIREEWLLRLWCAKEAVGKALGRGMVAGPCNLVVQDLEVESGRVTVVLMGELANQLPDLAGMSFAAHTGREGDLVFASALV